MLKKIAYAALVGSSLARQFPDGEQELSEAGVLYFPEGISLFFQNLAHLYAGLARFDTGETLETLAKTMRWLHYSLADASLERARFLPVGPSGEESDLPGGYVLLGEDGAILGWLEVRETYFGLRIRDGVAIFNGVDLSLQ